MSDDFIFKMLCYLEPFNLEQEKLRECFVLLCLKLHATDPRCERITSDTYNTDNSSHWERIPPSTGHDWFSPTVNI